LSQVFEQNQNQSHFTARRKGREGRQKHIIVSGFKTQENDFDSWFPLRPLTKLPQEAFHL
jgi:hypothetical protein